jgi:putative DNA primase/helicase
LITSWWTSNASFGVGVACGPAGLVVLDVDAHSAVLPDRSRVLPGIGIPEQVDLTGMSSGFHTLQLLSALRGLPSPALDTGTLRVRTPSGGLHIWYRPAPGQAFGCSTGSGGGRAALGWQVDVRAHGGYIIAPGTTTEAGTYLPVDDIHLPAPLPAWVAAELARTGHQTTEHSAARSRVGYVVPQRGRQAVTAAGGHEGSAVRALATVLAEVTDCAHVPEGAGFNDKLNRAAFTAGGLVAAGLLTHAQAEQLLQEAADAARPGEGQRSRSTIGSGLAAGATRPLPPETGEFDAHRAAEQILLFSGALPAQATGEHIPGPPADAPTVASTSPQEYATPAGLLPDSLSDRGNAKLFVRLYGRDYRHVPGLGWYQWGGHRWVFDEDDTVLWAAGEMAEAIASTDPRGHFTPTDLRRHRRRALSTSGMNAMLTQAKSAPGMVLKASLLDADPYALCTPHGVVDLRTGILTPPDPGTQYHSRSTTVAPKTVPTPRWQRFLDDTFGTDEDGRNTANFLHLLLGYSISGDVGAQVMPFLYGQGKNGKSVLLDVMLQLLGDYADAAPPGFLMAKTFEGHPTDLAELHGRRIIVCSELKPGDRFDEARVKLLTGGDQLKARRMRQDFFSFTPTHKLWLLGNHKPEVNTGGFAFWRRIRLIPFERVVADNRKIDNLASVLVSEEGPGILAWLVDGARRYFSGERDLVGPTRVQVATTAYAETEDNFARFLAEKCKLEPSLRAEQATLYGDYTRWCSLEAATPLTPRSFAARVRDTLGMTSPKQMFLSNSRKYYPGIGLLTDTSDEETRA